jgi:hypothetical protein
VAEVRLSLPNRRHFAVDLRPFGLGNDNNDNEVFHAADRPYGLIEGSVLREDAEDPGPDWRLPGTFWYRESPDDRHHDPRAPPGGPAATGTVITLIGLSLPPVAVRWISGQQETVAPSGLPLAGITLPAPYSAAKTALRPRGRWHVRSRRPSPETGAPGAAITSQLDDPRGQLDDPRGQLDALDGKHGGRAFRCR